MTTIPRDQLHAQEEMLSLLIVVFGESILHDVFAMHTIEMIPKSMILLVNVVCCYTSSATQAKQWCINVLRKTLQVHQHINLSDNIR